MTVGAGVGAPVRVGGPRDSWDAVLARLAGEGVALVHARTGAWAPDERDQRGLRRLLGGEWERYRSLAPPMVRRDFAASRLFLKTAVGRVAGVAPERVEIVRRPGGRPRVRGCGGIDVNLSHTAPGVMVVGLTGAGRVGVDVERADRPVAGTGLAREVCTPYELDRLAAMPVDRRDAALVRWWVLKEAYTKAIGLGLAFPFDRCGFGTDSPPRLLRPDGSPAASPGWEFGVHPVGGTHVAGVALCRSVPGRGGD
ncbi:4'-phosphopantetheinyl transferase superfamily protein [Streptomyces sp. TRM43335]|uniref:4'-phosphopantetheinyl transferase superfamily protein n=1 Tax=Streptomyces taklimakanensis TaxID=2569853 RepID=A0A6G2BGM8_9ACTN|nr:4'-phosphopantetheinyl transferase family protein [Streptomyces taklimakanensis]MTE21418.1 4'-phosphopantetheinyl transferase superfamily protein [Streptomyces taklimakanensis]